MKLQTPILLLIFNRPEQSLHIFEQIRLQQPAQLFIAADGPRFHKPGEAILCEDTRKSILEKIDWPCEVKTLFRVNNLGCGKAVSSAIDWFFDHVEEGIILEDDCLPDPTFFSFCSEMLERYRKDEKIMHVCGTNYQMGTLRGNASYYFSRYAHIWGWATWRRAWKKYDYTLNKYHGYPKTGMNERLRDDLKAIYDRRIDTWDIQWFMTVWFNKGFSVTPNTNLVRNIGYGKTATHTRVVPAWFKKMSYGTIPMIIHPENIEINEEADKYVTDVIFSTGMLVTRIKKIARNVLPAKLIELISG
jgi:hypothetical protein